MRIAPLGRVRLLYALGLLYASSGALRREPPPGAGVRAFLCILSARQATQALLTGELESRPVIAAGAAVDAMHALTMAALAVAGRHRRGALANAAVAALLSAAGAARLRPPRPRLRRTLPARLGGG